jgi:DNA-directed RNA polymerase specialized sigma24 family protein
MSDQNYVDNKEFYRLMLERQEQLKTNETVPISNELGKIILDICTNLRYHKNFINYGFAEDLIGEGIEKCIRYIDNFDGEKYSNPFAYFTQIAWWAFVVRIKKEYKQKDIREKMLSNIVDTSDTYSVQEHDMYEHFGNSSLDFEQNKETYVNEE